MKNGERMRSIAGRVRRTVRNISVLLAVPVVAGLVMMAVYAYRYQGMIRRMDTAAELKPEVQNRIAESLYSVAAGRTAFAESGAEEALKQADRTLESLLDETQGSGHLQLTIARRTMETLEQYVLRVRDGMAAGEPIDSVVQVVDEVRDVGRLVAEMLDAFIYEEITNANAVSVRIQHAMRFAAGAEVLLLAAALLYSGWATRRLTEDIRRAIDSLEKTVRRIAEGHFRDRATGVDVQELQELAEQINQTADQLETLIGEISRKQEHLAKAELRTMQAQINPHFLYNTLDTIVWQAESGREEEVVRLTRSLSDFFRISLSAGADWIPVTQEMKHVSAYLDIQKTRYRDILDAEVICPEGLEQIYMLKLLLQPLVENALYHGIKARRGGGKITVRLRCESGMLHFTVTDTGRGMTAEQLTEVREMLQNETPTVQAALEPGAHSGFGLRNVDMRIRLYYHKQKGLSIRSGPEGTEVSFILPVRTREEIDRDESVSGG